MTPLSDIQKWMENVVYIHLIRLGYQVYVGKTDVYEINFAVQKLQERLYVQVSFRLNAESTKEREIQPLLRISDHFPKIIVTLDEFLTGTTQEGIRIVHLREFLLKSEIS